MKLKRKVAKIKGMLRKHHAKSQSNQIARLRLQRNHDLKEAQRLTRLAKAKDEALQARVARAKANAPNVAARKKRNEKIAKGAKSAFKGLASALKAMQKYANKH